LISTTIEETLNQERMELVSKFDFGGSEYLEATKAKDKIMAMSASDASFNLEKLYNTLNEQNRKHDIVEDEVPTKQETNKELKEFKSKSDMFQTEHTGNVMRYIDNLKLSILSHAKKKDSQNMWSQTEDEYVHISEHKSLEKALSFQKDMSINFSLTSYSD
jgi:uncharacterized protein YajQ (UPF0234 family)